MTVSSFLSVLPMVNSLGQSVIALEGVKYTESMWLVLASIASLARVLRQERRAGRIKPLAVEEQLCAVSDCLAALAHCLGSFPGPVQSEVRSVNCRQVKRLCGRAS